MCVIKKKKKKIERAYEFKSRDAMLTFVTGRLKRALHESKLIYIAQFIIEVIEFGYNYFSFTFRLQKFRGTIG